MIAKSSILVNYRSHLYVILISVLYLIIVSAFIGLRIDHIFIIGIYNICFFLSAQTRKIILAFTVFFIFGILYDFMRAFPNYMFNSVDIKGLYEFDKNLFGITDKGKLLTVDEFFNLNHTELLDILTGLFYVNWISVPIAFAIYLFIKNKEQFLQYSLAFFFVNLIGFIIYYIHPAAPPWYVNNNGFILNLHVQPGIAGLNRFDALTGIPVFHSIYSRNSNIFAAIPSLHCAYPVVILFYSIKNKLFLMSILAAVFMLGIWFSAVYSGHHYVTDALMGVLCAIVGILIFEKILLKIHWFRKWIGKYEILIS